MPWWLEALDWLRIVVEAACWGAVIGSLGPVLVG